MKSTTQSQKKSHSVHFTAFLIAIIILFIILFFLSTLNSFLGLNIAKLFGLKPITITAPKNISVTPPTNITNTTIPAPKYTIFYESGLPLNTLWSISLPSGTSYSNVNYLNYSSFLKSFSFSVNKVFLNGCTFLPSPESGNTSAGNSVHISFSAVCNTTFVRYGLPNKVNWTVLYGNVSRNVNTNSTYFISSYGNYPFSVSDSAYNGCPYYPYPQSGSVNAGSSEYIIFFTTCSSKSNTVTFLETGLPQGYTWTIRYDNLTNSSNSTQIVFIPTNSASLIPIFNVSVINKNNCIFTPDPENGNATVGQTVLITFNSVCNTSVSEEGLPVGTKWNATFDNITAHSSDSSLVISSNYTVSNLKLKPIISGNCTFSPIANSSNPVAAGSSILVDFSGSCITSFLEKNLPVGLNWTVRYDNKIQQSTYDTIRFNTSNVFAGFSVPNATQGGCIYSPTPSTGNLTAGSSLIISFAQTCHTVFVSKGLPIGVSWSVDYDNQTRDGAFNSSIEFPYYKGKTFYYNVSVLKVGNCIFTPSPKNGTILAGELQLITFSGECTTTFSETGLPNDTEWNATFDNKTKLSTSTGIYFDTVNGSYPFSIASQPISRGCYYVPSPSSGSITAGSNETVGFTDDCTTDFIDPGLPSGANWTVTFAGITKHSINQNVSFLLPQGKYYYQVPQTSYNGCNYAPNQTSGSTSVGNDVHVTFNLTTCDTVFSEVGLPQGASWQVIFNGSTSDSQTNSISFSSFPGNYSFSVGKITLGTCVFSPNESSGFIYAGSSSVIGFSSLCYTDFNEKGLPVNSLWSVSYNSKSNSSIGTLIAIKTSYGTFPYSISNVSAGSSCYYIPQPAVGNDTAGTGLTVNYVEKCISTFYEAGLYNNVQWSVTYDGNTISTYKDNLSILNPPGNYSYNVPNTFGKGCIFKSLNSSGNLVSGGNASVYFSPSSCTSNITETGLPKNVNWSVSIDNITNYSTRNFTVVTTDPGNYSVHIPTVSINGCVFSTSYNEILVAGSHITVHFSAACKTIFTETGLPNGTKWEVNDSFPSYFDYNLPNPSEIYSYKLYSSTSNKIIVSSSNSSANPYSVESVPINTFCAYDPQPSSGSIAPGNNLSIIFGDNCITSFKETGLPKGTDWYVSFNNINASSNSNQISFLTNEGSYNFKVFTAESSGCFYTSNVTQGTLNTSSILNIKFTGIFCLTTFKETGLPSDSEWNVTFNVLSKASNTSKIIFNDSFSNNSYNYHIKPKSISEDGCHINLTSPSGTTEVGSYVNATYINTCKTIFNETGLPNDTEWDVNFDGVSGSSFNKSVIIYALPGNHSYTSEIINAGPGCFYYPKPESSYLVAGESASISYTKECLSTFSQDGLPSGATWSVKYDGILNSSSLSNISFITTPGNFSFSLNTVDSSYCSFLPSPASGYLIAGGNINISFIENTCNTTFIGRGLPANTQWKLTFDGITESPSNNNVTITTPPGIFTAKFYPINLSNCVFSPEPLSSSTAAGGYFTVHFTASCLTSFNETGLPKNTYWFVTYNGTTVSSNASVIKVPSINGTYAYSLPFIGNSSCSYRPNPSSGNTIAGSRVSVSYSGGCTTVFYENGLPPGSEWNLTYDNQSSASTSTSIQFVTPPGTFKYTVENLTLNNCLYVAKNGSSELAAGSTLYLIFNQTRCYTTFTEGNLPSNTKWTLTYNNINYSSNKTSLELSTIPGTFNFTAYSIKDGGCVFTPNPSDGHIAAGSSLLLSFSSSCITLFNETGLSKGITWSVKFDGITNYSSNSSLDVDSIYGNFSFSVPRIQVSTNCYLTPDPSSGYLTAGSSTIISFSNYCYSEFIETGLPSGISWAVKYDNLTNSSSLSDISFNIISGNYSFSVPSIDYHNCYFVSNESNGYAQAGHYTYVKFTEDYCISNFTESGLPSSTKWGVTFANMSNSSTKKYISLNTTKGLYNFTVPAVNIAGCRYIATPANGGIAAGSDTDVSFSVSFCITTFNETGLPLKDNWSVTYNSIKNSSISSNITFNTSALSSFGFSVQAENQSQCNFIPVPSSGSVTSGSTEMINFSSVCHTYFKEEGLPSGYTWIVNLNGKNGSSKSNIMEFTTSYSDNYTFKVYPSVDYNSGFLSNISGGFIASGSNATFVFSNDTSAYKKPVIIPISFYNNQSTATSQPFQQMLVFNSSKYSKDENSKLTNIMFTYQNGTVIPSWLESGNSNTSNDTVYWLKIKSIPAESSIAIDMIFNQTLLAYSNNFNINTTGEAPQLSSTYAEYDDGANVFNFYANFNGTSLNTNIWNSGAVSGSKVSVDNGLTISGDGSTSGSTYVATTHQVFSNNEILEGYINQNKGNTGNERGLIGISTVSNSEPVWDNNGGTGDTIAGWSAGKDNLGDIIQSESVLNGAYTYLQSTSYNLNWNIYSVSLSSVNGVTTFLNYGSTSSTTSDNPSAPLYINLGDYNTGNGASFDQQYQWIRVRAYPPNGVMPSVFINLTLVTTNLTETGLPQGYRWYASFDGINKSATADYMTFSTVPGRYNLSVYTSSNKSSTLNCISTYTSNVTDSKENAGAIINIHFSLSSDLCTTVFSEKGLIGNWSVAFDGKNGSTSASQTSDLSNITKYKLLKISNFQNVSTASSFQQMVTVNNTVYGGLAASNFQNVEFFYPNGTIISSWLENYGYSNDAVYWLDLGEIPANSFTYVYIGFASNSTDVLNSLNSSVSPKLGPYPQPSTGSQLPVKLSENYTSCGDFFNMENYPGGNNEMICSWGGGDVNIYMAGGSGGYSGLSIISVSTGKSYFNDFFNTPYCLSSYGSVNLPPGQYLLGTSRGNGGGSCGPGGFILTAPTIALSYPNGVMPTVSFIAPKTSLNNSNNTIIIHNIPYGNYTATASTNMSCRVKPASVEAGSTYVFSNWDCTTTFNQSTLPKGNNWWVDYNGVNNSNKTGSAIKINFNSSNSIIYTYSAGSNISCSSNGIADPGTSNNISSWACIKQFVEEGLPSGTNWTVKYDNKVNSSISNLITLASNFGNYSYSINNITFSSEIYVPNSSSGYTVSFGKLTINFSKHSLVTPQSIYKYAVLNITNSQTSATKQPFQQMINLTLNSSYNKYINQTGKHSFQNIEFFNTTTGKVLDSWLESDTSKYAIFWIKLPNGIPADTTIQDVAIGFASNDTNLFNINNTGEAPQLSPTYAEYDDGANVFNFYDNFKGTSLNTTKWSSFGSSGTSGSTSDIIVSNKLTLTGGGTGGLSHQTWIKTSLSSGSFDGSVVADVYENSPSTNTTFRWGFTNSNPTYFGGSSTQSFGEQIYDNGNWYANTDAGSSGTQNEIGSWSSLANTSVIWSIAATDTQVLFYNPNTYSTLGSSGQTITTTIPAYSSSIGLSLTNEYTNPISVYWVNVRAYPPDGVMPSVKLNTLVTKPITLFINGISNNNITMIYGKDSNFTVESDNHYVKLWKELNNSVVSLTNLSGNISTYSNLFAAGKIKVIGGSNSTSIKNVSYYNTINKATPVLNLVSNPNKNYLYNGTSLIINVSISTINNQLNATLYINGIFNKTINKSTTLNLSSRVGNYTIVLNTSGNQNYTANSITITRDIYPQLSSSLIYYMPINITNAQSIPTSVPFQQMINLTITSSDSQYINQTGKYSLQNVEFFNIATGKVLDSWLESYTSKYAIFWIKLPNGIPADTTIQDVAIGFASNDTNLFNTNNTGEAPQLSSTYGEYDDGVDVFTEYWNFAGTTVPSGWTSSGTVSINNGVTINPSSGTGAIETNDTYGPSSDTLLEFYGDIPSSTSADQSAIGFITGTTSYDMQVAWTMLDYSGTGSLSISTAYPQTIQTDGGTRTALSSPTTSGTNLWQIYWPNSSASYFSYNYGSKGKITTNPSSSLKIGIIGEQSTTSPQIGPIYWFRIRVYPPDGVMPSVSLGSVLP